MSTTLLVNTSVPVLVVAGTFIRVGQHFKCFVGLFEQFFRLFVAGIPVRVMLHGNAPVGLFDIGLRRIAGYTQYFVIIFFRHSPSASILFIVLHFLELRIHCVIRA